MDENLIYIPKYVRQESDMAFGDTVTHENYNEKLNLNTTQGDYNTEVLYKLFNSVDPADVYHIPYLDNKITEVENAMAGFTEAVSELQSDNFEIHGDLTGIHTQLDNIVEGSETVGHALMADTLTAASSAGPNQYYGTDEDSNPGFIDLPEFLYAIDMHVSRGVEGIYFRPDNNSIDEDMLTAEVKAKLNRQSITDYEYLDHLPKINSVTLIGNKTLSALGVQPAGDYITPTSLAASLVPYYKITDAQSWVNGKLGSYATTSWVNTQLGSYATTSALSTVSARANSCARVGVNAYVSSPQTGDIYFSV